MEQLYASQSQPVCEATLGVARDRAKAQSRRKYMFTDQIDQLIREIYLNHRDAKTGFGIRPLAKKIGIPDWAVKKRARELGLGRTKEVVTDTSIAVGYDSVSSFIVQFRRTFGTTPAHYRRGAVRPIPLT